MLGDETLITEVPMGTIVMNLTTAKECIERGLYLPALTLIYSTIDIYAWLSTDKDDVGGPDFIQWADRFLVDHLSVRISGDDLYSARCGVLHNGSSESQLTRNKKARKVIYLLGSETSYPTPDTQTGEEVYIHIEDLLTGLREGAIRFMYSFGDDVVPPWWEYKLNKILIFQKTSDHESGYFVQTL